MTHLELIYLLKMVIFHNYVSLPEGSEIERNIWALKSDEHPLSTVQRLSLFELEGRLKALNGCSTYTTFIHVVHTANCTHIWPRLLSLGQDPWAKTSLICTVL